LLQKSLIPFLTLASRGIVDSSLLISQTQGVKGLQRRQDVEWRKKVLDESKEKDSRRPQQQFIDAYITSCYLNDDEFWREKPKTKSRPNAKKRKVQAEELPPAPSEANPGPTHAMHTQLQQTHSIYAYVTALQQNPLQLSEDKKTVILPSPQNGTQYNKIEVLAILTRCSGKQRKDVINKMIDRKLVPSRRTTIYRMLRKYKDNIEQGHLHGGILNEQWAKTGRPTKGSEQYVPKEKKVVKKKCEHKHPKPKPPREPVVLPFPPSNGEYYLRSEFLRLVSNQPKGKRLPIVLHLIENKLVPVAKTTMFHFLRSYENDPEFALRTNDEWISSGRPVAFSDEEICNLSRYIHEHPRSYDAKDIKDLLMDVLHNRAVNMGQDASTLSEKISRTTVKNYMLILASKLEVLGGSVEVSRKKKGEVFRFMDGKLVWG
jgi:hypothetical protein